MPQAEIPDREQMSSRVWRVQRPLPKFPTACPAFFRNITGFCLFAGQQLHLQQPSRHTHSLVGLTVWLLLLLFQRNRIRVGLFHLDSMLNAPHAKLNCASQDSIMDRGRSRERLQKKKQVHSHNYVAPSRRHKIHDLVTQWST